MPPPTEHDRRAVLIYLSQYKPRSQRTMTAALNSVADALGYDAFMVAHPNSARGAEHNLAYQLVPWSALRSAHTTTIRARLAEAHSPSWANTCLSALRGVMERAWLMGLMDAETFNRAVNRQILKRVRGKRLPKGRDLSQGEITALVNVCMADQSPAGPRDAAMIGLMATSGAGLRRAEVVTLDLADYNAEDGRLIVRGKGNKEREAWVVNGIADALADWLALRGDAPGPLFSPVDKGSTIRPGRLSGQSVYAMLKKRAQEAGVKDFSPHDLRRTTVGDLLDAGVDISTVADMVGHESTDTTRRYDRRPARRKRKAAGKLHFPYTRRTLTARVAP